MIVPNKLGSLFLASLPWCFTLVGSGLTRKHWLSLERLSRNKHFSLIRTLVNYVPTTLSITTLSIMGCETQHRHSAQTVSTDTQHRQSAQTLSTDTQHRNSAQTLSTDTQHRNSAQTLSTDTQHRHSAQQYWVPLCLVSLCWVSWRRKLQL
jgi:hypothetical protein